MKLFLGVDTRDARPALAPTNMAAIIMEIFNSAMPQKKMVLPRPAPKIVLVRARVGADVPTSPKGFGN